MLAYPFLVLSLLFLLPGALIFVLRPDLRGLIARMSLCAIPFAFTEFLFYPSYWKPKHLFNLIEVLGFGVEDIIFVVGLASFTSTCYAAFTGKTYRPLDVSTSISGGRTFATRSIKVLLVTFVLVALVALAQIPMIYGACLIMLVLSAWIIWRRRDLLVPGLVGAMLSTLVYTCLCLVLGWLIPNVFSLAWNTDQFLNLFILGVPVEEIMYAWGSGLAATIFYPYVMAQHLAPRRSPL